MAKSGTTIPDASTYQKGLPRRVQKHSHSGTSTPVKILAMLVPLHAGIISEKFPTSEHSLFRRHFHKHPHRLSLHFFMFLVTMPRCPTSP